MRELQLDDIAIPCLGVLDLFVVRQGRERGPESVGTMISLGVKPSSRKRLLSVLFDSGASFEQENAYRRWPVSFWVLRRIASACRDKGTTSSQPVFILAAGI